MDLSKKWKRAKPRGTKGGKSGYSNDINKMKDDNKAIRKHVNREDNGQFENRNNWKASTMYLKTQLTSQEYLTKQL